MSSLIRWEARVASWAAATFDWLNWTHSSGLEELQQNTALMRLCTATASMDRQVFRLPCWDPSRVGLQGYLWRFFGQRQTGQIDLQGIHLVSDVSSQPVTGLLQNTRPTTSRCSPTISQ